MKRSMVLMLLLALVGATGCAVTQTKRNAVAGLPCGAYPMGGGFMIEFTAPTDGTAFTVQQDAGRILETKSVEAGEAVEFEYGNAEPEDAEKIFGKKIGDVRIVLYWLPTEEPQAE